MSLEEIGGPNQHCCKNKTKEESFQKSPVPKMKQLDELVGGGKMLYSKTRMNRIRTHTVVIEEHGTHKFGFILSRKPVVDGKNGAVLKLTAATWNEEGSQRTRVTRQARPETVCT